MPWKFAVVFVSLTAALGGCADARPAESPAEFQGGGRGGDRTQREQNAAGSAGAAPAPRDAGAGFEACPPTYPAPGSACRVPQSTTCTYRGDGPCSTTHPDRVASCVRNAWASVAPAIACNPPDAAAADGGALDCSRPLSLADFCNRPGIDCNLGFKELREKACDPMYTQNTSMDANDCGSRTLITRLGNSGMRYDFGPTGLVSVQSWDDVPYGSCMRHAYVYGEACKLLGMERSACSAVSDEDAGG